MSAAKARETSADATAINSAAAKADLTRLATRLKNAAHIPIASAAAAHYRQGQAENKPRRIPSQRKFDLNPDPERVRIGLACDTA
jgi:hypothetical protein